MIQWHANVIERRSEFTIVLDDDLALNNIGFKVVCCIISVRDHIQRVFTHDSTISYRIRFEVELSQADF